MMAAGLFSTEFREEMDEVAQKKAFEDIVRKVKQKEACTYVICGRF